MIALDARTLSVLGWIAPLTEDEVAELVAAPVMVVALSLRRLRNHARVRRISGDDGPLWLRTGDGPAEDAA